MRGKVDFTLILDLLFNPTPVNEWDKFFFQFSINAGPVEARPCPIPMDKPSLRSALCSLIHPSSPVPESPPGPSPLSPLESLVQRLSSLTNTCVNKTKKRGVYALNEAVRTG
jgi:hypothetical protein